MDTEKLVSSLRIACHHPGGKNNRSPGSSVTDIAEGTAWLQKSGKLDLLASMSSGAERKMSTWDVLLMDGLSLLVAGFLGRVAVS